MEWRALPWLDGFEVSENGDVRHTGPVRPGQRSGQRITGSWKPSRTGNLYRWYTLNRRSHYAHRLVCEAFHGPAPEDKPNALHNDGNSRNNHFTNLRWGTQKENGEDSAAHGVSPRGSRNGSAKLSEAEVAEIRAKLRNGAEQDALAAEYGCCQQNISRIACAETWRHVECDPIKKPRKTHCARGHILAGNTMKNRGCRTCHRDLARQRNQANRERVQANYRRFYAAHRDAINAKKRALRAASRLGDHPGLRAS